MGLVGPDLRFAGLDLRLDSYLVGSCSAFVLIGLVLRPDLSLGLDLGIYLQFDLGLVGLSVGLLMGMVPHTLRLPMGLVHPYSGLVGFDFLFSGKCCILTLTLDLMILTGLN